MDGRKQRTVVSAIERAAVALGAGDATSLRREAHQIRTLNQLVELDALPALLEELADAVAAGDQAGRERVIAAIGEVLGPSPLAAMFQAQRSGGGTTGAEPDA